jgi:hypothetical protein
MNNLFYTDIPCLRRYSRDSKGRFADRKDGIIDRLERENAALKQNVITLRSQMQGYWKMMRMKDLEIEKLKNP